MLAPGPPTGSAGPAGPAAHRPSSGELEQPRGRGAGGGRKSKRLRREEASGDDELQQRRPRPAAEGPERLASAATAVLSTPPDACAEEPSDAAPQRRPRSGPAATARSPGPRVDPSAPKPELAEYRLGLAAALRQIALAERREARARLWRDARRLGRFRRGLVGSASDRDAAVQWEGGTEAEQIEVLRARICEQKQQVERSRKSLNRPRAPPQDGGVQPSQEEIDEEIWEQRELCNTKIAAVHRDEQELREREQRLHVERVEYLRQLRAVKAEDQVDFGSFLMLQHRYQLLRLLSRGGSSGSSAVYSAHDLHTLHSCCVRIHQLDPKAPDREASLRAISQECETVKQLRHPGLMALLDYFPHENGSVATVWDHRECDFLDSYLLRNGPVPEKEARGIVLQLLSTLRFVESRGHRLDSQDLRPSRLAFRGGEVRVGGVALLSLAGADGRAAARSGVLGMSEVLPDSCGSIEPQGAEDDLLGVAGDEASAAIRVIGMTLYQALFGKCPEAPGMVAQGVELSVVQLPDQPKISVECREYLLRLLDRDRRLTLQEAYNDPFVAPARKPRSST